MAKHSKYETCLTGVALLHILVIIQCATDAADWLSKQFFLLINANIQSINPPIHFSNVNNSNS